MKVLKSLNTTEMGIDVNDVKILINSGFQYLMKTCHQWAKDHPLVSCVLIFFYLLYIFSPSLFSILFYTFPLVICTAILLGGSRIKSEKHNGDIKYNKKEDDETSAPNVASSYCIRRPYLQPQMSRRTFGKDKKQLGPQEENKDQVESVTMKNDPIEPKCSIVCMSESSNHVETSSSLDDPKMKQNSTSASRSDIEIESQEESEEDDPQEETNKVVQWTENDERNLMDLGSSEMERNRRLESLIAKRRARKLLSMQPRRNHIDYLADYYHCDHPHLDSVGSLMVPRAIGDAVHQHQHQHQLGSFPSLFLPTPNPFDLPYDPQEEKPILTGGSFEEEFFARATDHNDFSSTLLDSSNLVEDPNTFGELNNYSSMSHSLPSFFSKPRANHKPGSSRFGRESEAEDIAKENAEETSLQGDDNTSNQQESTQEVQSQDQTTSLHQSEEESQIFEPKTDLVGSNETKKEDELVAHVVHNEEVNASQMDPGPTVDKNENQVTQDQLSVKEDHNDGGQSSSSSSSETNINASKNEAFRNSVRKVLTCLVKRKGIVGKEKVTLSSSDLLYDSSPTNAIPTKMEERLYYTSKTRHTSTLSIASDMLVEVSDTGSPKSTAFDPNSPTDRESLVYDGDVERDANSGDEDLWGVSPHPMRLGDSGTKFKLPDIIEEGKNCRSDTETAHNASDPPTVSRTGEEEAEQAPDRGASSSLSPRSILPEENRKDLIDEKSTNGDIIEHRTSVSSSSSESLDSEMQGKSENVAVYLANLPPSESGFNGLEDPWQSQVRETGAEEITIQDENNPIFEMDEDKEDSKERKELEAAQESSDHSSGTGQSEAPKETSLDSSEHTIEGELKKEQVHEVLNIVEQNQHSEVESIPLEKDVTEANSDLREPQVSEKEVVFDSYSTNSEEDIINPSRSAEASDDSEEGVTSRNQVEGEVKVESTNNPIIHEASTSMKDMGEANQHGTTQEASASIKDTGEAIQYGTNQEVVNETNKEDIVNLPED